LSGAGKSLALGVALAGAAAVLTCLMLTSRSLRAIDAAAAPAPGRYTGPTTLPDVQTLRRAPTTGPSVRVAVIGGMTFTGFWNALADRYEKQTGVYVELIGTGPKNDIVGVFKQGNVDVITMHSSDAMVNLAVHGYTLDPQPWMRNDLVIVGPPEDPARIRGMTDAEAALKRIADSKAPFVVHSSLGAQEVLLNILEPAQIQLDPAHLTVLFDDQQRTVLKVAGDKHAYTLVGRIPFRTGRLPNNGLELMVQGDDRLKRPYLVAVTNPAWMPAAHIDEARKFVAYLRSPATQGWLAGFGKGMMDDQPLFFPVVVGRP
jgi:tungstate transport system substrate-binding protein